VDEQEGITVAAEARHCPDSRDRCRGRVTELPSAGAISASATAAGTNASTALWATLITSSSGCAAAVAARTPTATSPSLDQIRALSRAA
jgi:hypothetical protein